VSKKLLLIGTFILIIQSYPLFAQNNYIKTHIRYGIPASTQTAPEYFKAVIPQDMPNGYYYLPVNTWISRFSLAEALSGGVSYGIPLGEVLSFELGLDYMRTKSTIDVNDLNEDLDISTRWIYNSIYMTPALVFNKQMQNSIFSLKAGFITGLSNLRKSVFYDGGEVTYKLKLNMSLGYNFGIEYNYKINDQLGILAECGIENMFYTPAKAKMLEDDFDYYTLEDTPEFVKNIKYYKKIDQLCFFYDPLNLLIYKNDFSPSARLRETLVTRRLYFGIGFVYNFFNL
jgi:hypothetical protein